MIESQAKNQINTLKFFRKKEENNSVVLNLKALQKNICNSIDCLIVLNCKILPQTLCNIVECCQHIILADGGANHFYNSQFRDSNKILSIVGDLDSIKQEIKDYYEKRGVKIQKVEDQNYNDFQKSLNKAHEMKYKSCLCLGAMGGRIDHTLSAISITTKFARNNPQMQLALIGDGNLMMYLQPNITTTIQYSDIIQRKGCGLITFSKAQNIQTSGFRWNLGQKYEFSALQWGQFLSTSNQFSGQQVSVLTSHELFFVAQLNEKWK